LIACSKVYILGCPNNIFKKNWTQNEINFLKENYEKTLNKDLARILNRGYGSIDYMALKLGIKKDYDFACKSKRKLDKDLSEETFKELYLREDKSIREIAKILGIGKNTADYYLKKYKIKKRNKSQSSKLAYIKYSNWCKGLNKEKDPRLLQTSKSLKLSWDNRNKERLRKIEEKYGKSIKDLISNFYWKEGLTQEKISQRLGVQRELIIRLMKELEISKRSNFEYIAGLKGINRPAYGKKWEELSGGLKRAKERKREMSLRARKNIIKRLQNNEMPFFNTKIEKKFANWMIRKKLPFYQQYVIDNKFVCDFALPLFSIIVECDGDYWHANPKIYDYSNLTKAQIVKVKTDKFKDLYLNKKGWKVFRFFETDIHKDFKKCTSVLEAEINEQLKSIKNPLDEL
jgi:very-short-patch-repair endonuclease/transposase